MYETKSQQELALPCVSGEHKKENQSFSLKEQFLKEKKTEALSLETEEVVQSCWRFSEENASLCSFTYIISKEVKKLNKIFLSTFLV